MEAARSSGFSYIRSMRYIILRRRSPHHPPLINQFLNLMKNSSLAMTIGVMELTYQARQVESYTFKGFEAFSAATLVYLALSFLITGLMTLYNKKVLQPSGGIEMVGGLDFSVIWENLSYFFIGRYPKGPLGGWGSPSTSPWCPSRSPSSAG